MVLKSYLTTIFLFIFIKYAYNTDDLSRGFGSDINWMRFEDALEQQKIDSKPIFLLIHKTWCGACQNLKSSLSQSFRFKELSDSFLMVNLEDDEEPKEDIYAPDGSYIPRILFIDGSGQVNNELINENGNPSYKYFYSDADQVIESMDKAIETFYEFVDEDEDGEQESDLAQEQDYDDQEGEGSEIEHEDL